LDPSVRVFTCNACGQLVFFENTDCLRCLRPLGYVHDRRDLVALEPLGDGRYADLGDASSRWRRCGTAPTTGCNWLVRGEGALCESCRLTRTRPADGDAEGLAELVRAEQAKRRLVFELAELGLPVTRRDPATGRGVAFDLLSSVATKVVTGHDDGVITLDLAEADDEHREQLRRRLDEPYRTLLGHFRHEIGHYYWPLLVHDDDTLSACRALFGDDRTDYGEAVKRHYSSPPALGWEDDYISRYATMHPYEDWAETFAHYLHIVDVMQVADSFGLGRASPPGRHRVALDPRLDPTRPGGLSSWEAVVADWLELTYALNQINRSMGYDDLYPFVLAPKVIEKLAFVDQVVHRSLAAGRVGP
jgi:hypothetical protein